MLDSVALGFDPRWCLDDGGVLVRLVGAQGEENGPLPRKELAKSRSLCIGLQLKSLICEWNRFFVQGYPRCFC